MEGFTLQIIDGREVWVNNNAEALMAEAAEAAKDYVPLPAEAIAEMEKTAYINKRQNEYPPITDFVDAWVKQDDIALEEYRLSCLAVKAKYPKSV